MNIPIKEKVIEENRITLEEIEGAEKELNKFMNFGVSELRDSDITKNELIHIHLTV